MDFTLKNVQFCQNLTKTQIQIRLTLLANTNTSQFTKYTRAASWMQWYNLFGLYWGMFFVSALRCA